MDALEAIHSRRSIRRYRPDPVPRTLLEELLFAAVQAPTPPVSGDSPWTLAVIEGVERLAGYGERAKTWAREHQPAPHAWTWSERPDFRVFWDAPALVLLCARRGHPEAPFDCHRAAQNLLIAAHARGLGSCWVGAPLPWLESPGVTAELGLPDGFVATVAVILGYADEQPSGNPRPPPEIHWCGET